MDYREEVRFAYLFGSRIEGVSRSESDLDLAIYLDKVNIQKLDPLFETRLALEEPGFLRAVNDYLSVYSS